MGENLGLETARLGKKKSERWSVDQWRSVFLYFIPVTNPFYVCFCHDLLAFSSFGLLASVCLRISVEEVSYLI